MKKAVSLLLTMTMVLSLAACGKSEETKKPKKPKRTTTTEATETEKPTEQPSDTTETTEELTSATSDTTAPSQGVTHDLTAYEAEVGRYYCVYGAIDPTDDNQYGTTLDRVEVSCDVVDVMLDYDNPEPILKQIDEETFTELFNAATVFNQEAAEFAAAEKSGKELSVYYKTRSVDIYRADSKIFSYVVEEYEAKPGTNNEPVYTMKNFDSATCAPITFEDVITDPDALIAYVQENLSNAFVLDDTINAIKDKSLVFGILYDGIYLYNIHTKIPAIGNENMLNMSLFTATPEVYSLMLDAHQNLEWDIDGDGNNDSLCVQMPHDDSILITINAEEYEFGPEVLPEVGGYYFNSYYASYVFFTHEGCYLLVQMSTGEDDYSVYAIFELKDGKAEFKDFEYGWLADAHDPNNIEVGNFYSGLGFINARARCSIKDGKFVPYSALGYVYTMPYQAKTDIKGKKFDHTTMDIGDDVVIKAGSKVTISYYSGETKQVVLRVLDPADLNQYDVLVETDGERLIDGKNVDDVLEGILWAG